MSTRMLIDARHSEETRVAVVKGNRVEEFDYESSTRRQLKGNIYLAKVTRVEPSLQAAFVEYGGNRQGFLAFSEIHPDYYQIPISDRQALIEEESKSQENDEETISKSGEDGDSDIEQVSGDDDIEEIRRRRSKALRRRYKIQEVIKKRQILLVQVAKEERGTKGAALTTYLSLAGRYCVLMPNSTHSGGISRKISNQADRKHLKNVMTAIDVPSGMGCIIRTAGLSRTKAEIKRDFDYLLRLWNGIRELTLKSVAPTLIYEEANLIKRSIRDLYTREIDEVLVEGEEGYKTAKQFMRLLMPSHAKKVKHYRDRIPLFHRYQVEAELESMFSPTAQLKSGGYVVINPTEALVAIDVNSGRSTKEHNIEETAFKTNLEAAEEIARQLRLRDMAGLIVIDFIDMDDRSNQRKVEKRMKDMLKTDRARIQVGRLSSFGLMEMSRQRLRPNLIEASMEPCPNCDGSGIVRSVESSALRILRELEEEGIRSRSSEVTIMAPTPVALYLLNQKRGALAELEERYGYRLIIENRDEIGAPPFEIERIGADGGGTQGSDVVRHDAADSEIQQKTADEVIAPEPEKPDDKQVETSGDGEDDPSKRRRRRRRRRGRRGRGGDGQKPNDAATESASEAISDSGTESTAETDQKRDASGDDDGKKRSRRGRRGGRRRRPKSGAATQEASAKSEESRSAQADTARKSPDDKIDEQPSGGQEASGPDEAQEPRRSPDAAVTEIRDEAAGSAPAKDADKSSRGSKRKSAAGPGKKAGSAEKKASSERSKAAAGNGRDAAESHGGPVTTEKERTKETADSGPSQQPQRKRQGWWQRTFGN